MIGLHQRHWLLNRGVLRILKRRLVKVSEQRVYVSVGEETMSDVKIQIDDTCNKHLQTPAHLRTSLSPDTKINPINSRDSFQRLRHWTQYLCPLSFPSLSLFPSSFLFYLSFFLLFTNTHSSSV